MIGAGFAGLLSTAAAATAGLPVVVIEQDSLVSAPPGGRARPRKGVPQAGQLHILLNRGLRAMETLLPGIAQDLERAGAYRLDSADLPWLGEFGWMPTAFPAHPIVSASRPLVEQVVRQRVADLPGVSIHDGVRVGGLRRSGRRWRLDCTDNTFIDADLVVDASGRSSRLLPWLSGLGTPLPEPRVVDAQLGYACREYRLEGDPLPTPGVVVAATPERPRGGIALRIEEDRWLIVAAGYGPHRPGRTVAEFDSFLTGLPDPAFADLLRRLEPIGDVAVHRQTANRRHRMGGANWPPGLLGIGDSACAFDPVYGQGITVAACQAERLQEALRRSLERGHALNTRRVQRRLLAVADLPWSVATSQDLRQPSSQGRESPPQRAMSEWTAELARLASHGHQRAYRAVSDVYHLAAPPRILFHPALLGAAGRARLRGYGPANPRPAALAALAAAPARR